MDKIFDANTSDRINSITFNDVGNLAVIGGYAANNNTGVVRVYHSDGGIWNEIFEVYGEYASERIGINSSITSAGDRIVISGYYNNDFGFIHGAIKVFEYDNPVITADAPLTVTSSSKYSKSNTNPGDGSYIAMSGDGKYYVTGDPDNDKVYVYRANGQQVGSTIVGRGNGIGHRVAINEDGSIIAVRESALPYGVMVYEHSGTDWVQKGPILGEFSTFIGTGNDYSNIDLSKDGLTIAITGYQGSWWVKVYKFSDGVWVQMGATFNFQARGLSIRGDGKRIAMGNENSKTVQIYNYSTVNDSWTLFQTHISSEHGFGFGCKLSKYGDVLAVLASHGSTWRGKVMMYRVVNGSYMHIGTIDAPNYGSDPLSDLALNDAGDIVAFSNSKADTNYSNAGVVCVYHLDNGIWTQIGSDFTGEAHNDYFGGSISMSSLGHRWIAHSSHGGDKVRVYDFVSVPLPPTGFQSNWSQNSTTGVWELSGLTASIGYIEENSYAQGFKFKIRRADLPPNSHGPVSPNSMIGLHSQGSSPGMWNYYDLDYAMYFNERYFKARDSISAPDTTGFFQTDGIMWPNYDNDVFQMRVNTNKYVEIVKNDVVVFTFGVTNGNTMRKAWDGGVTKLWIANTFYYKPDRYYDFQWVDSFGNGLGPVWAAPE